MKHKNIATGLALLAAGFGLGFVVARSNQPDTSPKPKDFGWFDVSSFSYSSDLPDSEVDRRLRVMCEGAIEVHRNNGIAKQAEDVHYILFGRLDELPVNVIERNQSVVLAVVEVMLRSPYHQNVFGAQKYVMRHLELGWMGNFARDYVKRFDEFDYAFGSHGHHLPYFLRGANEVGASQVSNADNTYFIKPETKAYTDFADYVVNHQEDLSERKSELNAREIRLFVEARKKRDQ